MNRQERRRLEIKKKDTMVYIKQSDIDRIKEEATEKGCKMAFNLMLAVPAMVIHDKFGNIMIDDITGHSDLGYGMDMDEEEWEKLLSRLRAEKERRTNGRHG